MGICTTRRFFSVFELLVLVTALSLLVAVLVPLYVHFASSASNISCRVSLRSLAFANIAYANDNAHFVPAAASDRKRWFGGASPDGNVQFDWRTSPLHGLLGDLEQPTDCPALISLFRHENPGGLSQRLGSFGYGYNLNIGSLGGRGEVDFWDAAAKVSGVSKGSVGRPDAVVMFADAATRLDAKGNQRANGVLNETAELNPPFIMNRGQKFGGTPEPTTHFLHRGNTANVAWVDGSVSPVPMGFSKGEWGWNRLGFVGGKDGASY